MTRSSMSKIKKNRDLLYKVLTDPKFRRQLQENPTSALRVRKLSQLNVKEIKTVLAAVREIDVKIGRLADELLCANDGPCGIA